MKCVFEASSGLEAYMVSGLLQQAGIIAQIDGEYLQGGIGELQATGFVRVLVSETDFSNAEKTIQTWDANQTANTSITPVKNKSSGLGFGLFIGLLMGIGGMFLASYTPPTIDGIDFNNDGTLDEKWVYRGNNLRRIELDRNLDGAIDNIHLFNRKSEIYKSESDNDFDGIFEGLTTYKRGLPHLETADTNQDGIVDLKAYYTNGVLKEVELSGPTSTSPKKRQYYDMGKLKTAKFDSNGDGSYDKQYEYDDYEQIKQ